MKRLRHKHGHYRIIKEVSRYMKKKYSKNISNKIISKSIYAIKNALLNYYPSHELFWDGNETVGKFRMDSNIIGLFIVKHETSGVWMVKYGYFDKCLELMKPRIIGRETIGQLTIACLNAGIIPDIAKITF